MLIQAINKYQKTCYLVRRIDMDKINDFFKTEFGVDNITDIHIYMTELESENNALVVDITGFKEPLMTIPEEVE